MVLILQLLCHWGRGVPVSRLVFLSGLIVAGWAPCAKAVDAGGYLFVTFRGENSPMAEQVYFMVSPNGRDWEALNQAAPVLVSTVGERGARDPFILRSPDGLRFHLIATDLSIYRDRDWGRAVTAGSKSLVVWDSPDLVNWSEPRLVKVAPDDAGCTWAPEAIYDEAEQAYLVFWASQTGRDGFAKHRIWAAYTRDFHTFGEPFVYIEKPMAIIDTTIVRDGGRYYRFTKDEELKTITMEQSSDLRRGWEYASDFSLKTLTGYEGPASFVMKSSGDDPSSTWCLLLDNYSKGTGYEAFETNDLASGRFEAMAAMNFPFQPVRHGAVIPVSAAELSRLRAKWEPLNLRMASDQSRRSSPGGGNFLR